MTTAYTSLLGLALPVTGELSGTWGDTVNDSVTSLLDSAVAGTTTISSDADVTLTTTTGASNTSRQAIILWTAGGTVTRNITAPAQSKIYTVINKSSSTQSIVLRGVGPTTGVTIVQGESAVCAWNGSDFIKISNTSGAGVFTTLSVSGAVTLSGGTANGVAYLNGSKVLTTGSALVFDGTNLGLGGTNNSYGSQTTMTLSGTNVSRIDFRSNSTFTGTILSYQAVTEGLRLQTEAGYPITFYPAGTEAMRIGVATGGVGAVGIGYSTLTSVGNNGLAVLGNVGIGTSSPLSKLDVRSPSSVIANYQQIQAFSTDTSAAIDLGGGIGLGGFHNSTQIATFGTIVGRKENGTSSNYAGYLAFGTNAQATGVVERMRIDSSGNLLVGQTSKTTGAVSTAKLGVTAGITLTNGSYGGFMEGVNTSGTAYGYLSLGSAYNAFNAGDVGLGTSGALPLLFATNNIERARIDSSGNLSIGATSTTGRLLAAGTGFNILGNAYGVASFLQDTTTARGVFMGYDSTGQIGTVSASSNGAASNLAFWTYSGSAWAEKARIDSSGNLLVGTTDSSASAGAGFKVIGGRPVVVNAQSTNGGATVYEAYSTGAGAYRFYVGMGGTVFATSTTISAISDIRFKENIRDLDAGLSEVLALKPRLYDWKEGKGANIKNARGFIAQEFEEVFPDLIDEWKDEAPEGEDPYKSVRQDLIPVLVKAIQEQQAIITQLTARITALESA